MKYPNIAKILNQRGGTKKINIRKILYQNGNMKERIHRYHWIKAKKWKKGQLSKKKVYCKQDCIYQCNANIFKNEKYSVLALELFIIVKCFDEKAHFCETCHKHLLTGKIPYQAVCNKIGLHPAKNELKILKRLQRILI